MIQKTISAFIMLLIASSCQAEKHTIYVSDEPYDDVVFAVESAILDRGLVIESESHVGEMLARTGGDVGSAVDLYTNAIVFNFCSASVSRIAMEADIMNIAFCPYGIFVFETPDSPGVINVGHQLMPGDGMEQVNTFLDEIIEDALGL